MNSVLFISFRLYPVCVSLVSFPRPDAWIAHVFETTPRISPHLLGFFIYEDFVFRESITEFGDTVSKVQ